MSSEKERQSKRKLDKEKTYQEIKPILDALDESKLSFSFILRFKNSV